LIIKDSDYKDSEVLVRMKQLWPDS